MDQNATLQDINNEQIDKLLAPIVYLSIIMAVGIPGNLTVLIIYWKTYSKSVYRTIIWILAVIDLLFCTCLIPFNIGRIIRFFTFYNVWVCKFFTTCIFFCSILSSHIIVVLAIHRFRQVCMPLKPQINPSNIKYWIAGGITISVVYSIPEFILRPLDQ